MHVLQTLGLFIVTKLWVDSVVDHGEQLIAYIAFHIQI